MASEATEWRQLEQGSHEQTALCSVFSSFPFDSNLAPNILTGATHIQGEAPFLSRTDPEAALAKAVFTFSI